MQFHRSAVLLLGGAGLVLLAGLIVTLLVVREPEAAYAPNSPQSTVASFLRQLEQGEVDSAYALTTTATDRQSFQQQFGAWHSTSHRVALMQTTTNGNIASVTVRIRHFSAGAIGLPEESSEATFTLERQGGTWRISDWSGLP